MSEEFSLLDHLSVSVPEPSASFSLLDHRQFKVVAPTRRAVKGARNRQVPKAPLADFTGEVLTVKGRNYTGDTEYVIYNSRIPSIQAVNMQLMKEKQRRQAEGDVSRMSPNAEFFQPSERDYASRRRRLLENLQRINMEQAQRKMEERQRERERRLGRQTAKLKVNSEQINRGVAIITIKNKSESEGSQHAVLMERDGRKDQDTEFKEMNELVCSPFPWDTMSRKDNNRRAESLATMDDNRELAEDPKKEQEMRKIKERSRDMVVLEESRAKVEEENTCLQEKKRSLQHIQRSYSLDTHKENAAAVVKDGAYDTFLDWFPRPRSVDENIKREKERKIMETNRKMAEEAKRRRLKEEELRIQNERNEMREAEELYRRQKELKLIEKRNKQDQFFKYALNSILEREVKRHAATDDVQREDFFFRDNSSKYAKERQKKEERYYDTLKKDMESAREARLEAREREIEHERRLLQEAERKAQLDKEKKQKKAKQKRECYVRALEEQISAKATKNLPRQMSVSHSGPERKVLYRCPVTGDLLPPEQFGIPLSRYQGLRRRF
ncbi:hypothetical protein LSM04_001142 [Trypanosoma melophagium]|uniref:uncharacterized protein n=1 Tax=Trypanosoma melophagium TaxID=715481 RepID=UPI00351A5A78|nr:hypothetical protein LSM04_001142 [Trypanosoma melophagium]